MWEVFLKPNASCLPQQRTSVFHRFVATVAPYEGKRSVSDAQSQLSRYPSNSTSCLPAYVPILQDPSFYAYSENDPNGCAAKQQDVLDVGRSIYLDTAGFSSAAKYYESLSIGLIFLLAFLFAVFILSLVLSSRGKLCCIKLHED